jgi:hypothetical protein
MIIGNTNETEILLNDIPSKALLDTGSYVSIIFRTFYEENFRTLGLKPLTDINIECADCKKLPYDGYIDLKIRK